MDGEEQTQATQDVLDPRRLGQQNSGFSDDDISDIICILYPHSATARQEVAQLAQQQSPHVIGRDDADEVQTDRSLEDDASNFDVLTQARGNHAIILRLSANVKDPEAGYVFGRNALRGDIVFTQDTHKRISNVHFRIFVNEYGSVMVQDQSTNGTIVDDQLLSSKATDKIPHPVTKWMLTSGSVIKIHLNRSMSDLIFRVRIPRRDDQYAVAYQEKVHAYFERHGLRDNHKTPVVCGGIINPSIPRHLRTGNAAPQAQIRSPIKRRDTNQVSRREWTGSEKYNVIRRIGKGAFAVVHQVTSKYDGAPYAAKELDKRRFVKNGVLDQKVENEMRIMERITHPNIVKYMETLEHEDRLLIIIMEYVGGGDLGKLIQEYDRLDEDHVKTIAEQLLGALNYLHLNRITHRDIKPDNILIESLDPLEVKLTDFGLSKMVESQETFLQTFCGTLLYCAPEVYTEFVEYDEFGNRNRGARSRRQPGQRYDHAIDIWSLGGVLFYCLAGAPPFPVKTGISHNELLHMIMTTELNVLPLRNAGVSEAGIDFLRRMLDRRPDSRAGIDELTKHPWLGGEQVEVQLSQQSFDELTDEEDLGADFDTFRQPTGDVYGLHSDQFDLMAGLSDNEDHVSDSVGHESDAERNALPAAQQQPDQQRLFGEVDVSAAGSSGVMPDNFFHSPRADVRRGDVELDDSYADEAYVSDSDTSRPAPPGALRRTLHRDESTMHRKQSSDQLQSLVHEVASQSLGGKSRSPDTGGSYPVSFTTSKRKPPSNGSSGEYDDSGMTEKPEMKRLRSETSLANLPDTAVEEFRLLAGVPQVTRTGRQIDWPVDKAVWWGQDRKGWHLVYPEMTQLQLDAFNDACKSRGEEFAPGKSPLWDLAMKYFPPSQTPSGLASALNGRSTPAPAVSDTAMQDDMDRFPPTAAAQGTASLPPTQGGRDQQIVVPLQGGVPAQRAIALVESRQGSVIQGISLPIADNLLSFGRGFENTQVFTPSSESRVPKYAFKILLWADGYDPSKDPAKVTPPWAKEHLAPQDSYAFWISTKATMGIKINGYQLASSDAKNPSGPSRCWVKLHDNDELEIWGGAEGGSLTLTFRCFWGGSSRAATGHGLELAAPEIVDRLNAACAKTEKRVKDAREKSKKISEAKAEYAQRRADVERERERSRVFEEKRREAVEVLQVRSNGAANMAAVQGNAASTAGLGRVREHQRGPIRMSSDLQVARSIR